MESEAQNRSWDHENSLPLCLPCRDTSDCARGSHIQNLHSRIAPTLAGHDIEIGSLSIVPLLVGQTGELQEKDGVRRFPRLDFWRIATVLLGPLGSHDLKGFRRLGRNLTGCLSGRYQVQDRYANSDTAKGFALQPRPSLPSLLFPLGFYHFWVRVIPWEQVAAGGHTSRGDSDSDRPPGRDHIARRFPDPPNFSRYSSSEIRTPNLSAAIRSSARRISNPFSEACAASRRSSGQWPHRWPSSSGAPGHKPASHSSSRRFAQCTSNLCEGLSGHSPATNLRRGPPRTRYPERRWPLSPPPPDGGWGVSLASPGGDEKLFVERRSRSDVDPQFVPGIRKAQDPHKRSGVHLR